MILRILVAGILGGAVMFLWGFVAHTVLQFDSSIKGIPNEDELTSLLRQNLAERGLYQFPYADPSQLKAGDNWEAYVTKFRKGPTGLLVYVPSHENDPMAPEYLIAEGVVCFALATLAAMLLAQAAPALQSYVMRIFFLFLIGLIAGIAVPFRNWIWWEYPSDYVMLQAAEQAVGFFLAGLIIAAIVRRPAPASSSATPAPPSAA
ncbi:MAG: hypothetical protein NZM31_08235 [Gemmatales bacterium]|nr:hypothetical protein [Gemmatales bacterium]MDW8386981.1 hypothetical protein [Gemmatales bacterium]